MHAHVRLCQHVSRFNHFPAASVSARCSLVSLRLAAARLHGLRRTAFIHCVLKARQQQALCGQGLCSHVRTRCGTARHRGKLAARPPVAHRPSRSMRASARVASAQRAHSIVLCTPTASYARLRSLIQAAAPPRASTGASLAPRGRAAAQCNAGPALYGDSWEPAKFLEEGKGEEEEDVAAYGRMQAGGGALLVVKGLEEPLQVNQVSKMLQMLAKADARPGVAPQCDAGDGAEAPASEVLSAHCACPKRSPDDPDVFRPC